MDVLFRLRVLIWLLVFGLWGVMVYQYLGEDEDQSVPMRRIVNPYPAIDAGSPPAPERPADPANLIVAPAGSIAPARAPRTARRGSAARPAPRRSWREDRSAPLPDPPVPDGFQKSVTRHFNVYAEQAAASGRFLELIENLHGNLMLDLAPFSPWAGDQKVSIFLFRSQDAYRRVTGRPLWSGGASSVPKRKVYIYESGELPGILAHELTHIYFDGFFLKGSADPLWLSEGMATLLQVERGLAAPNWLRENLRVLESGGGLPFKSFLGATTTSGWTDDAVRLWYTQAYSVVRYLIRTQYRSSFYKFASSIRSGRRVPEALYRAYGAPYTRVRALEIAWRHEVSRRSLERLPVGN